MEKLSSFIENISKGEETQTANENQETQQTQVDEARKADPNKGADIEDLEGKDEEENDSGGRYAIDPPTDDDITKGIDKETLSKNSKRVYKRLLANKPFFIQGEAGWGKTSIIVDCAHKVGRTVVTVYLDKCEATDLGGVLVPKKSKKGADYYTSLMPVWAKVMYDNPETQFLLFFDEMNQAQPDVMNALMPIVLKNEICGIKFENFIVGAAGNFEHENTAGINELSAPLLSRFGGTIIWESGDWKSSFQFLKKKYGKTVSPKFLDIVESHCTLFKNPRDIEQFIVESVKNIKANEKNRDIFDADDYLEDLKRIAHDDLSRSEEDALAKLAEECYKYVNAAADDEDKENGKGGSRKSRKDVNMINDNVKNLIEQGITRGYIVQPEEKNGKWVNVKYGISRENINVLVDLAEVDEETGEPCLNAEMLERIISMFEGQGKKFKYQKDQEWKDAGYKDPNED